MKKLIESIVDKFEPKNIIIFALWTLCVSFIYLIGVFELERSLKIKISFSEIGQIIKDRKREGSCVDDLTLYLAGTNDLSMKIYEAWVVSQNKYSYDSDGAFAFELDMLIDKRYKFYHYDLADLFEETKVTVRKVMKMFSMIPPMVADLKLTLGYSEEIWREEKDESGHWEETCSTDSKGVTSCSSYYVCDYIDYDYRFSRSNFNNALEFSNAYLSRNYEIPRYEDNLKPASQTNADGEYIVERTRSKEELEHDLQNYKLDWIINSTVMTYLPRIRVAMASFQDERDKFVATGLTSKDHSYRDNFCGSGNPPREMKIVKSYSSYLANFIGNLSILYNSFTITKSEIPVLEKMVKDFVNYKLDKGIKKISFDKDDILDLAGKIQKVNFDRAEQVHSFRWWLVILLAFVIIILGGFITFKILEGY